MPAQRMLAADVKTLAGHEAKLRVTPAAGATFATRCADLAKVADQQGSLGPPSSVALSSPDALLR